MKYDTLEFDLAALTSVTTAVQEDWEKIYGLAPGNRPTIIVPSPLNADPLALVDYENGLFQLGSSPAWGAMDFDRVERDSLDEDLRSAFSGALHGFEDSPTFRRILFQSGTKVFKRFAQRLKRMGRGHLGALAIGDIMSDVVNEIMQRQRQKYSLTWRMKANIRNYLSAILGLCARFVYGDSFNREARRGGQADWTRWFSLVLKVFRD